MAIKLNTPVQIRLTSSVESVRASLEPYSEWIEQKIGVPLSETLTLEVDCNPGDAVAEELLQGLPVVSATKARNSSWRTLIEGWSLPPGVSPRIAASLQRERRPNAPPFPVWEIDWQDCPVAFRLRGLSRWVISVKVPTAISSQRHSPYSPLCRRSTGSLRTGRMPPKVLLLDQRCRTTLSVILKRAHGRARLQGRYDWDAVVLDSTYPRMVRRDFELFFQREEWFRQHNLPYRRGYLFWGAPGNGKSATLKVMAAHPHIPPYSSI